MKLIKDLGLQEYGNQGRKRRFGTYECPCCGIHFRCRTDNVNQKRTTKCLNCANKQTALNKSIKAKDSFEEKASAVHNDRYDYTLVEYVNNYTHVDIICPMHGSFSQMPYNHLTGAGCPSCGVEKANLFKIVKAKDSFEEKASAVHNNYYDYTLVNYTHSHTTVDIICPIHGEFSQRPLNHLQGRGCQSCANYGFDKTKPAIVYYLSISNGQAYKIGITNRTVKERFSNTDIEKITIIKTWDYLIGAEAYAHEQQILEQYKDYKYTGETLLSSGNTELFIIDILELA